MSQQKTLEERLRERVLLPADHELHQESAQILDAIKQALEEARMKAERNNQHS